MPGLPVGTLTFLFTDIEVSTEGELPDGVELRDPGGASAQGPAPAS